MPSKTLNADLRAERQRCDFDVRALSTYLYGGPKALERREFLAEMVAANPKLRDPRPVEFMSREERYENATRKILECAKVAEEHTDVSNLEEIAYIEGLVMAGETQPFNLHYVMFLPTLQNQATPEQQEKWLPLALSRAIVGTYAQTEMGHGTNLRRLETTATYDPSTRTFDLHSPTLTATKWWPGNLGKTANYAVVMAQLWSRGTNHGPHPFIVQLRHADTHMPLPGVEVGDIGPKFGMQSNDNGFLRLSHLRIPLDHMLMRNAQLSPDGVYSPPSHSKLGYGAMIFVRTIMLRTIASALGKAATIATRYSCVRRQGELGSGGAEVQLLDYSTQQYRILPAIASALAFFVSAGHMRDLYQAEMRRIHKGDTGGLAQLHALSSGLKAHITWEMAKGIEQCRLACGGHGYLKASGLPELYGLYVGSCTYEGDNIVLLLQVARFLMKEVAEAKAGRALSDITQYLAAQTGRSGAPKSRLDQRLKPEHICEVFEHIARRQNFECLAALEAKQKAGVPLDIARNEIGVSLCKAARSHVLVFLTRAFHDWAAAAPAEGGLSRVLAQLSQFYLLHNLVDKAAYALEDGFLSRQQLQLARSAFNELQGAIRLNAVGIVDAWGFQDAELRSVLGRYDGNVYENLMAWAQNSSLNKSQVLESHHKYIGPMMKDARAKL